MTNLTNTVEEKQDAANKTLNRAKAKLEEKQAEANDALAQAKGNLERNQTVANGRITQAKGFVREKWGELTNDETARRAGRKEQVKGHLQANYGNSWAARNSGLVITATVTALAAVLAYLFARKNSAAAS